MTPRPAEDFSSPASLLALCEVFSQVAPAVLASISPHTEVTLLARGQFLTQAGEPADCLYTVVYGRLHAFATLNDGSMRFEREIGPGETIGEVGLIDPEQRMGAVRAVRDTQLIRLSRTGFEELVRHDPEIMTRVARIVVRRVSDRGHRTKPKLNTIAIIPAGGSNTSEGFADQLCRTLSEFGSTLHLDGKRFEQMFGTARFDPDNGVVRWLCDLDMTHRFVVLECESSLSPWTMLCLRLADRILAVGNADSTTELNEVERHAFQTGTELNRTVDLVLLHEHVLRVFSGSADWLQPRPPLRHHHMSLSEAGDMRRLARIIAGRAIGLTLGGGGARGLAHIGVIRAIQEAGIPIDMIGGVSMGAILAGQYAMGFDWQTMLQINEEHLVRGGLNSDFTLPLISITSGRRLTRALHHFFQDATVEDLWLNYFCVSCSLTTRELIVHRSGPLEKCIRASNSLPGILPPVLHEGHVLIDGGIINNQPGDIMKEMCGGPVIVSNVSPRTDLAVDAAHIEMPSGWRVLWSRLNPFVSPILVPSISETMMRTLLVASDRKSRAVEGSADFYVRPSLRKFRLDDWPKIHQIVDAGYECTKREIETWQAKGKLPH